MKYGPKYETEIKNNYAFETLINGNISECISNLKEAWSQKGLQWYVIKQMDLIKTHAPERYEYIIKKISQ